MSAPEPGGKKRQKKKTAPRPRLKVGTLSTQEEDFIRLNAGKETAEEIGRRLGRSPDTVRGWIARHLGLTSRDGGPEDVMKRLRNTVAWRQLREEFSLAEIAAFEERYVRLAAQFEEDLPATEETQVCHAIKIELLMHRAMAERKHYVDRLDRLRERRLALGEEDEGEREELEALEEQARASARSTEGQYLKFAEEFNAILRGLKATRDQRVSKIESARSNFLGLIKAMQDEEFREAEGRHAALMKLATEREARRLGEPTTYGDGTADRPLLSAETVGDAAGAAPAPLPEGDAP